MSEAKSGVIAAFAYRTKLLLRHSQQENGFFFATSTNGRQLFLISSPPKLHQEPFFTLFSALAKPFSSFLDELGNFHLDILDALNTRNCVRLKNGCDNCQIIVISVGSIA